MASLKKDERKISEWNREDYIPKNQENQLRAYISMKLPIFTYMNKSTYYI